MLGVTFLHLALYTKRKLMKSTEIEDKNVLCSHVIILKAEIWLDDSWSCHDNSLYNEFFVPSNTCNV